MSLNGQAGMVLAIPTIDANTNKATGVLVAQLQLDAFPKRWQGEMGQSEAGHRVIVTDAAAKIFFNSQAEGLGQPLEKVLPNSETRLADAPNGVINDRLRLGLSAIGLTDQQPDMILGSTAITPVKDGLPLSAQVITSADIPTVLQQQRERSTQLGLLLLVLLGTIGVIAGILAKRTSEMVSAQVDELEDQYRSLEVRQQRSLERSQWLGQMIETMRQSMGEMALLNTTVTELRYALNADRVMFYRCNDDWSGTIIAESVGSNYRKFAGQTVHDLFREGAIERYQDGQVQVIPDVSRLGLTRSHREMLEKLHIKASLIAPILQHGKLIGLLCAHQCSSVRYWETEDVDLFAKLSSQLAFVLEQSALLTRQARSVEKSRILNEIVDSMRRSFKEDDILNTTVNELRYTLDADRVVVYRLDSDYKAMILSESVGLSYPKICGRVLQNPFPKGVMERYRMGQVWVMPDVDAEGLPPEYRDLLDEFQVRSSIVAPIIQSGELMGLLAVHTCQEPRAWEAEDIGLVGKLGSQLGLALNQAAILRRQTLSAERLRTLNEIVSAMRRSLKQPEILNTAVNELRIAINTDRVILYRFDNPQTGQVIAEACALSWEKLLGRNVAGIFKDMPLDRFKNGHVRAFHDVQTEIVNIDHLEMLEDLQIRAMMVAPILQNGELTGLLCAQACEDARRWETQDVDLFAKLAIQIGYALDQAEMIADTERARQQAQATANETVAEQRRWQEAFQKRAEELMSQIEPLLNGDFTVQARVSDDTVGSIAQTYNEIVAALRQTIMELQSSSYAIAVGASDSQDAVSHLSQDMQQQIQVVAQAMGQVQGMMNSLQDLANQVLQAEKRVHLATQQLIEGDEVMDRTVLGMSSIRETVAETAKKVKRLGEASQKISRVVNLINGFATQTNLLAMNASIEAAKAGEEGQGFVVVAEEVRALAQQSAAATAEIEQVVEEIQRQTNEVVAAMETGTEHVVHGTQLVEESRQQLQQISEAGVQLNQIVQTLAKSANSQTEASNTVRQTMQQMADLADSTSYQTQNVALTFNKLLKMAVELQSHAAQFKVRHERNRRPSISELDAMRELAMRSEESSAS
jgi:methyl-accepting chemotaxis protein PixJ